jgi:hypothetical protein
VCIPNPPALYSNLACGTSRMCTGMDTWVPLHHLAHMCTEPDVEVAQEDKACTGPSLSLSCLYMFQSDIPVGKMMKISVTI